MTFGRNARLAARSRSSSIAAAAFAADSGAASRTAPPPIGPSVAVTVYNQNLALVRETRNLKLDRTGVGTLRFMDVPSQINPRTVHVQPLSAPGARRCSSRTTSTT